MPIRRGEQFLESLRDGRQVWLRGEKVDDVTTHPALAGFAKSLAEIYDLQHDPAHQEQLTMKSPSTGEVVSLGYLLPRSTEDLIRVRHMTEFLQRRCGGVAARLPHYMATMLVALYDLREILGQEDPAFASNIVQFFEYCRENDLCLTVAFGDPQRPQNRPSTDFEFLKVVERRPDGIIIKGCKPVATLAPYANEFLGLAARPGQRSGMRWMPPFFLTMSSSRRIGFFIISESLLTTYLFWFRSFYGPSLGPSIILKFVRS